MEEQSKNTSMRIFLPGPNGPLDVTLTQEEISIVNKMQDKYPGKYKGGEGVFQAILDYRRENEGKK